MKNLLPFFFLLTGLPAAARTTSAPSAYPDLENVFAHRQWDETAEMAYEIGLKSPRATLPRMRGAFALFQKGFSNSALRFLKDVSVVDWRSLPEDQERFGEIVSLFEKKVPLEALPGRLDQLDPSTTSPYLRDEIRFARGRQAYEKKSFAEARRFLGGIGKGSRYYAEARYLLGTIAVAGADYVTASSEFSRVFEPAVLEQSSEFWRDISSRINSHWGASLEVTFDSEAIEKASRLGELSLLALARISYATKDFEAALGRYAKVHHPRYEGRATLETIWTLLALNRNDAAASAAARLSDEERFFESVEARPVRALILVDSGRTEEAREELKKFFDVHARSKDSLLKFRQYRDPSRLPAFVQRALQDDERLQTITRYEQGLSREIASLRAQELRLFPVYAYLAVELESARVKAKALEGQLTDRHIERRLADLDRLYLQAKLITAESYLEDREKQRDQFRAEKNPDEKTQRAHDATLAELLQKAVSEVDFALAGRFSRQINLEFRQAELYWELATARGIVAQTADDKRGLEASDDLKRRALRLAEDLHRRFPRSAKEPEILFFLGFAQLELGGAREADGYFTQYVKSFPKHTHAPDAYRILADGQFDANHFQAAEALYRKILEVPETPIAGYALYKIGWCAYNEHDFGKSLLAFEKAVVWSGESGEKGQSLSLQREARHDLISVYAEVGDSQKAFEYFRHFIGAEAPGWALDLARQLEQNGQYERANALYAELIRGNPGNDQNLFLQASILRGYYKLHQWPQVEASARELADRYADRLSKPVAEGEVAGIEASFREILNAMHQEFDKTAVEAEVNQASEVDRLYLGLFRNWPSAQQPLYLHAYFLLRHHRNAEAREAYREHWRRYRSTLKEPLREEALRNCLHAEEEEEVARKDGADSLTPAAEAILDDSTEYLSEYGKLAAARKVAFLRSAILFKYHQVERGMKESQALFDESPTDSIGHRAFNNLRVAYYQKKDWSATYAWATELRARRVVGMSAYHRDLDSIREETRFLRAEGMKDDAEAAKLLLEVADDPSARRLGSKARYNAFLRLQRSGREEQALQVADDLERADPKFERLAEISGVRAALYQEAGDYARAYPLLATFLKTSHADVSEETLQQARLNAGLLAEALGAGESAGREFQKYLAQAKDPKSQGAAEAQRGLRRLGLVVAREPASAPADWGSLARLKADFERQPLPKGKLSELGQRLEKGGLRLQELAKRYLDLSSRESLAPYYAFEAYCAVPSLYRAYRRAVEAAGATTSQAVKDQLATMTAPLDTKAKELAEECLKRGSEAQHFGPNYQAALRRWGWQSDEKLSARVGELRATLEKRSPYLDPAPLKSTEAELLAVHLRKQATADSWYTLGIRRLEAGRPALARLTFVDALAREKGSAGRLWNALAVIEDRSREPRDNGALFEKAGKEGSPSAWANLAVYQLRGARVEEARAALTAALDQGAFGSDGDLRQKTKDFLR